MKNITWYGCRKPAWERNMVICGPTTGEFYANLPLFSDEVNHSPTGFEWGYCGSGPAQLAYAILRSYFYIVEDNPTLDLPIQLHQRFKNDMVARWSAPEWKLYSEEVKAWLDNLPLTMV